MAAFRVDQLIDNSVTDFDLYLDTVGQLTLYAKAPYKWQRDELTRLLSAGHQKLFYFTRDAGLVEAYRLLHKMVKVDPTLAPTGRIVNLTDAAAELTRILYDHPLSASGLSKVHEIAHGMVSCVEEDPSCISALGQLANHDYYTYYHSARVSAYALAIALHLGQREPAALTQLATGAMLHDVGKSRIDLAVLHKQGALAPQEWELMKQHPLFGEVIVQDSLLALMPREVILHHHERLDGTGYPHNLMERELLEEVKIVAFADVFDALTTDRPYHKGRTHYEALEFIKAKLLKNMHKDSYNALIELLRSKTLQAG